MFLAALQNVYHRIPEKVQVRVEVIGRAILVSGLSALSWWSAWIMVGLCLVAAAVMGIFQFPLQYRLGRAKGICEANKAVVEDIEYRQSHPDSPFQPLPSPWSFKRIGILIGAGLGGLVGLSLMGMGITSFILTLGISSFVSKAMLGAGLLLFWKGGETFIQDAAQIYHFNKTLQQYRVNREVINIKKHIPDVSPKPSCASGLLVSSKPYIAIRNIQAYLDERYQDKAIGYTESDYVARLKSWLSILEKLKNYLNGSNSNKDALRKFIEKESEKFYSDFNRHKYSVRLDFLIASLDELPGRDQEGTSEVLKSIVNHSEQCYEKQLAALEKQQQKYPAEDFRQALVAYELAHQNYKFVESVAGKKPCKITPTEKMVERNMKRLAKP